MRIIEGLPEADYHAIHAMSASRLKVLEYGTPAHLTAWLNEDRTSEAMRIGSAMHSLVLTPEHFARDYAEAPECDRRTTAGKALWSEFESASAGKTVLSAKESAAARGMAASVAAHPDASKILAVCDQRELTVLGEIDGIPAKMRLDLYSRKGILADIKTMSDQASPRNCESYAVKYGVWLQQRLYARIMGVPHGASIIFVESKPPHCVAVRTLAQIDLECYDPVLNACIAKYRRWMANPHEGWESGEAMRIARWRSYELEQTNV